MFNKKSVDKLSADELERLLKIRRREERIARFRRTNLVTDEEEIYGEIVPEDTEDDATSSQTVFHSQAVLEADVAGESVQAKPDDYAAVRFVDDEMTDVRPSPRRQRIKVRPRKNRIPFVKNKQFNFVLLGVEMLAVIGLIGVLAMAFYQLFLIEETKQDILDTSNQTQYELEMAIQDRRATSTPVPQLAALVLPGGHVWSETGNHSFNYNEIPASVRPAVRQQIESYQPINHDPLPDDPRIIRIPEINVNHSIIPGDDWQSLQAAVGHQMGSGTPDSGTNMVLTAHNDIYGEIFRDLPELKVGDEVYIETASGTHTYRVTGTRQVEPHETWVMAPDVADMTLITCYPYRVNTHRWIVFAEQVN